MGSRSWLEPSKAPARCQELRVSAPLLGDELVPSSLRLVHEVGLVAPQPRALSTCSGICHEVAP